jgi:hypothetical protein
MRGIRKKIDNRRRPLYYGKKEVKHVFLSCPETRKKSKEFF